MKNNSLTNTRPRSASIKKTNPDSKSHYMELANKYKCPVNKLILENLTENQIELNLDEISNANEVRHLPNILAKLNQVNCVKLWTREFELKNQLRIGGKRLKRKDPNQKNLSQNPTQLHRFAMYLNSNLAKNDCLLQLCLFSVNFSENSWELLSNGLKISKILSLVINHTCFTERQLEILLPALSNQKYLKSLDLSYNNLGEKSGYILARIIGGQGQRRDTETWTQGLRNSDVSNSDGLEELILGYNKLGDFGWEKILTALNRDM